MASAADTKHDEAAPAARGGGGPVEGVDFVRELTDKGPMVGAHAGSQAAARTWAVRRARAQPDHTGHYCGFDHIHWWVGNAKLTADWYVTRMGFQRFAYRGLETGSRDICSHAVRNGKAIFVFSSQLNPVATTHMGDDVGAHLVKHGDGVKDVAFTVTGVREIFESCVRRGGKAVLAPTERSDEHGTVIVAAIRTYGDTIHSLIERTDYRGPFLPGFRAVPEVVDAITTCTDPIVLDAIDHVVGNQPAEGMLKAVEFYERVMNFHRFWSVDDKQMHTEYSALRSIVMQDWDETIKMPINEPAPGKRKSQIQEYVEYYGGEGVQHIALRTRDILHTITTLRARGVEFLRVPDTYYESLRARLARSSVRVAEDLDAVQRLNILVDFDDRGYLLQLFTKPLMDRPTVFLEIIQRAGNQGFGAGNFKALFEAIEREQEARGNLV